MTFTITELANDSVLVEGTDRRGVHGEQVLVAAEWFAHKRNVQIQDAKASLDQAFEAFYAPLTAAAEQLADKLSEIDVDPLLYVVEQEGSAGAAPTERIVRRLDNASVILRAIEEGHEDRLIWVNKELVLTKPQVSVPAVPEPAYLEVPEPPATPVPARLGDENAAADTAE